MTYRGITFNALIAGVPSVATEQTGTFLGKPYTIKQPQQHFRQSTETLTYRGVQYTR
ncbi:MAG: DUF4278 domain-containing protein [Cyanobacteria bacterium P01_C01_bin.70]